MLTGKMNDIHVSEAHVCPTVNGDAGRECAASIDDLLDQAVAAINRGDRVAATALAAQMLAVGRKLPAFGRESRLSTTPSRPVGGPKHSRNRRIRQCSRPSHRLGPGDVSFEAKRFRHVAVAIPQVRISRVIAMSPRQ